LGTECPCGVISLVDMNCVWFGWGRWGGEMLSKQQVRRETRDTGADDYDSHGGLVGWGDWQEHREREEWIGNCTKTKQMFSQASRERNERVFQLVAKFYIWDYPEERCVRVNATALTQLNRRGRDWSTVASTQAAARKAVGQGATHPIYVFGFVLEVGKQ
jgi:hypothetical protein